MNNIQFYRQMHNMSQKELAKKVNMSPQTIAAYESESRFPSLLSLCNIARVFGVNIDCLISETVRTPCQESIIINDAMDKMSADDRARLLDMMKKAFPNEFGLADEPTVTPIVSDEKETPDNNMYNKTELCDASSRMWNDTITSTFGKKFEKPLIGVIRRICTILVKDAETIALENSRTCVTKTDIYEARNRLLKRQKTIFINKVYEAALNDLIETTTDRLIENLLDIDYKRELDTKKNA